MPSPFFIPNNGSMGLSKILVQIFATILSVKMETCRTDSNEKIGVNIYNIQIY